jgi:hypothetical protein
MREHYLAKRNAASRADEYVGPAQTAAPEIGFVSQNSPTSTKPAETNRAAINRANAQLSTGPRSPTGNADEAAVLSEPKTQARCSSRNATKHGLASGQLIIPGEEPAEFDSLLAALLDDHQPVGETEALLIKEMAQSHWLAQRAIRLQNTCFTQEGANEKSLSLFLRYFTTHNRAFHKALADLQRLQKERRKQERGFVSQSAAQTAANIGFVSQTAPNETRDGEFVRQNDPSTTLETGFVSQTELSQSIERRQNRTEAA